MSTMVLGNRLSRFMQESSGFSNEVRVSQENLEEVLRHYYLPVSRRVIVDDFYSLADEWKNATRLSSSMIDICMHPAYQHIIGMGKGVLPLIFSELERQPDYWFWALKAITGYDPVKPHQRGNIPEMTKMWLKWAKENLYL
mgnify:CR=1 FL=1